MVDCTGRTEPERPVSSQLRWQMEHNPAPPPTWGLRPPGVSTGHGQVRVLPHLCSGALILTYAQPPCGTEGELKHAERQDLPRSWCLGSGDRLAGGSLTPTLATESP